jgi:hypothetical protein
MMMMNVDWPNAIAMRRGVPQCFSSGLQYSSSIIGAGCAGCAGCASRSQGWAMLLKCG